MVVRVLIVDDHYVVREGLRAFFEEDPQLEVVGEAVDGQQAFQKAYDLQPDVVLLDLVLPVMDGIATIKLIRRELPEVQIVALTDQQERDLIIEAIRAGAIGHLFKDAQASEMRQAIKAAAWGHVTLSRQVQTELLRNLRTPTQREPLTDREMEVLRLMASGYSNKEIASFLHLGQDTVKTHVRHILSKLNAESRTQAVLIAIRHGLIRHNGNGAEHMDRDE